MTKIIATFKIKDDKGDFETTTEDINDMLSEIGEKEDMELISWGTI